MQGICFLGAGEISQRHIKIIQKLKPDWNIAIASRDQEKADQFKHRLKLADAFYSYDSALGSDYQYFVVATPPRSHADIVRRCLTLNKHAIIEKPLFNSMDELKELYPQMIKSPCEYWVAENLYYAPFQRQLKAILAEGVIGKPLFFDFIKLGKSSPAGWRADADEMPYGALHEGGVHWINRLLDLAACYDKDRVSSIDYVQCSGPEPTTTTPHEDTSLITIKHGSGLTSRLLHTWAVPWRFIPFNNSKIIGEKGAIYFDIRGVFGKVYTEKGNRTLWPTINDSGGYQAMWKDFIAAIEEKRSAELSLEDITIDFVVMDAAYQSRQKGETIHPDFSFITGV